MRAGGGHSARAHLADKRGGRLPHVYLDESMDASPQSSEDLIALDDALNALEETCLDITITQWGAQ